MPSRARGRRASPPAALLVDSEDFDFDFMVSYSDEEEEYGEEEEEEGSEEEQQQQQEEEDSERSDEEEEQSDEDVGLGENVDVGCGPSAQARVSGGVAAETASTPTCPVCMEPWTSQGAHRISCIPCGHVYGRSCLERWLTQRGNIRAPCPQCGRRFKSKDIINIYAPEVTVVNNDLEKQVVSCWKRVEAIENLLTKQGKMLEEILAEKVCCSHLSFLRQDSGPVLLSFSDGFSQKLILTSFSQKPSEKLKRTGPKHRSTDGGASKRQKISEHSDGITYVERLASASADYSSSNSCCFVLQNELSLDGARVMGIDASNQIILTSGKAPGIVGEHVLTKISMLSRHEPRKIQLPPNTKVIKDICILPCGSALFASLGRRLSLFSMTTETVVLQCDLPAPGWSCSADESGSHHVYAGLQNGMILVFDIRQTARPLHSMVGLSTHLVHTLHSVTDNNGSRKVLSASSIGPCMWDADGNHNRPTLLLGTDNQNVCISLACAPPSSDLLVASFRPKADLSGDDATALTQLYPSQTQAAASGSGKAGQHFVMRRTGNTFFAPELTCAGTVSDVRLSKSAIIPWGNNRHLFAYGDESLHGVRTWQLPSFGIHTDLSPHRQPILDLRYAESPTGGSFLGCLSEEKLQVFRVR